MPILRNTKPILSNTKLRPTWTISAPPNEVIWKLLIAPNGILVGEERNPESKQASIFAFDLNGKALLWREKKLEESWWFATEKASPDVLLIQTFQSPNLPEPKGIIALDIWTGAELWNAPNATLLFASNNTCFASEIRYGIQSYLELDVRTGEIINHHGSDRSAIQSHLREDPEIDLHSFYVQSVTPDDPHFSQVAELLGSALKLEDLRGAVEFLKFERYLIVSFHIRVTDDPQAALQGLLRNEMVIIDTDSSELIFRETLQSLTPLPLPDSFFVSHRTLLYVKEKHTLTGIRLD